MGPGMACIRPGRRGGGHAVVRGLDLRGQGQANRQALPEQGALLERPLPAPRRAVHGANHRGRAGEVVAEPEMQRSNPMTMGMSWGGSRVHCVLQNPMSTPRFTQGCLNVALPQWPATVRALSFLAVAGQRLCRQNPMSMTRCRQGRDLLRTRPAHPKTSSGLRPGETRTADPPGFVSFGQP